HANSDAIFRWSSAATDGPLDWTSCAHGCCLPCRSGVIRSGLRPLSHAPRGRGVKRREYEAGYWPERHLEHRWVGGGSGRWVSHRAIPYPEAWRLDLRRLDSPRRTDELLWLARPGHPSIGRPTRRLSPVFREPARAQPDA